MNYKTKIFLVGTFIIASKTLAQTTLTANTQSNDLGLEKQSNSFARDNTSLFLRSELPTLPGSSSSLFALRQDSNLAGVTLQSDHVPGQSSPEALETDSGKSSSTNLFVEGAGVANNGLRGFGLVFADTEDQHKMAGFAGGVGAIVNQYFGLGVSLHQGNIHGDKQVMFGLTGLVTLGETDISIFTSKDAYNLQLDQLISKDLILSGAYSKQHLNEFMSLTMMHAASIYKIDSATSLSASLLRCEFKPRSDDGPIVIAHSFTDSVSFGPMLKVGANTTVEGVIGYGSSYAKDADFSTVAWRTVASVTHKL